MFFFTSSFKTGQSIIPSFDCRHGNRLIFLISPGVLLVSQILGLHNSWNVSVLWRLQLEKSGGRWSICFTGFV
ncbi:unnamed protein product [Urochloa humidicola]